MTVQIASALDTAEVFIPHAGKTLQNNTGRLPDFIVKLDGVPVTHLILETKGRSPRGPRCGGDLNHLTVTRD